MPSAAAITASSAAPSRYRPVLIGSWAQFTQNAHSRMPRARARIISAGLNPGSATQVLHGVRVLTGLDHAQAPRLSLEARWARGITQLPRQLDLLLLELRELLFARLGPLPRLQQVHHRVQVGDHHPEEDEHEGDAADAVPADPARADPALNASSGRSPGSGVCPAAHRRTFVLPGLDSSSGTLENRRAGEPGA